MIMALRITNSLPTNDKIISFYNMNNHNDVIKKYVKLDKNNVLMCSYNVHGWVNINADISYDDNFKNIFNLLSKLDIDILILQEVCIRDQLTEEYIFAEFGKIGYVDYIMVKNGGCFLKKNGYDYLMVLSKKNLTLKKDINVTLEGFTRHCAIVGYDKLKLLCVHLEIGKRFHHLPESSQIRQKIEKQNATIRMEQLNQLLHKYDKIDIIIGDFNFMPTDPENKWLLAENYKYYGEQEHTTPYNRTDMVFIHNTAEIEVVKNDLIRSNYSDHLPILCEFKRFPEKKKVSLP